MNLKKIQAIEYFIFEVNPNKQLVITYNEKLITADFLSYGHFEDDQSKRFVQRGTTNYFDNVKLDDNDLFATQSIKDILRTNQLGELIAQIDEERILINAKKDIDGKLLTSIVRHVENFKDINLKPLNVIPKNITFLDTGVHLPFYLFDENDEFSPISVIDRKEEVK